MDRMSDCIINPYSSGVCVLGTKSCVMKHTGIVERDKRIAELEEKIKGSEVYLKEGETIVQCLERNRRDAANARVAESKFREDAERFNQLLDIPALQDELCWLFEIRSCDEDNLSVLKAKIVAAIDAAREGE